MRAGGGWGAGECGKGATPATGFASGTTGAWLSSAVARGRLPVHPGIFRVRRVGRTSEGSGDTAGAFVLDGALTAAASLGFGIAAGTEDSGRRPTTFPPVMFDATVDRVPRGSTGVPPAGSGSVPLPVAIINFDGLEGCTDLAVSKTWGGTLGAFTLASATTPGAGKGFFLARADLLGLAGTARALFFLETLTAEGALGCASRLIGSGVARRCFMADFAEVGFGVGVAALGAREERAFRIVERTREAALFLPALAVRNLPFFIAIVSPAVGDSETEHYGRMHAIATEFPGNVIAVKRSEHVTTLTPTG